MTEPEDLEEDLFADLYVILTPLPYLFLDPRLELHLLTSVSSYDADDSATKPQQAVNVEIPESTVAPAPAQGGYDSNQTKPDAPPETKQESHSNGNYANGQDNETAMNWNNGQADGAQNHHYGDGPPESHGIGIKEDG